MKAIEEIHKEFWGEFLSVANQMTDLYMDTTPTVNPWIQVSAGKQGIVYTCKVRQYATQVMVNIDNPHFAERQAHLPEGGQLVTLATVKMSLKKPVKNF